MMNRVVRTGIRPAAALLFAGAVAVLIVLTLLTAPPGSLTEAQSSGVDVMATSTRVVIDVTGAAVTAGRYVSFNVPGYTSTGARDGADPVYQTCHFEAVALDSDGNPGASIIASGSVPWHCRAGNSVFGYFDSTTGTTHSNFRMTITDVEFDGTVTDESTVQRVFTWQSASRSATTSLLTSPVSLFSPPTPGGEFQFWRPGRIGDFEDVSSTSANAGVQVQVRIQRLPSDMPAGSSVVIYLDEDYVVPERINRRTAWLTFTGAGEPGKTVVSQPGRHYPSDEIELDTGDYLSGSDDHSIRIYLPDLSPGDTAAVAGFQGAVAGQTLTVTLSKAAGIRNPSEAGAYRISYAVLGPNDEVPGTPTNTVDVRRTYAKVGLSDDSDTRGKEVIAVGTGFNDGVTATLYMKHYATAGRHPGGDAPTAFASSGDPNAARRGDLPTGTIMTPEETCADIIINGTRLGAAMVGSDDRVEIPFTINNPPFRPGPGNLLCMEDGEGATSATDVEHITLTPSIAVTPESVSAGNIVTLQALDFPAGLAFRWVKVAGQEVIAHATDAIANSGKATIPFAMPGNLDGSVKVEACWGGANAADCDANGDKADATITVSPSLLSLSKIEVRPNESVIMRGAGFSQAAGDSNDIESITIDDVPLTLGSESSVADIEVSNAGQFSTTVVIWSEASNNPALTPGEHRIRVADKGGYVGLATITILEPTVTVEPELSGPREFVNITGVNWPVANDDGADLADININISGGGITADNEDAESNTNGVWSLRWRVPGNVAIPSTISVRASYGDTNDLSQQAKFRIPSSDLTVAPSTAPEGAEVILNGGGFAPFESNITVKIGSSDVAVPTGVTTNREGDLEDMTVRIPALDDGVYTVQLQVGDTVALAELRVLESARGEIDLLEGLAPMGSNFVRLFYFNSAIKFWFFHDPRPDFDDLNTQVTLTTGHAYWILVDESQTVTLNGRARTLTCYTRPDGRENCWNVIVW